MEWVIDQVVHLLEAAALEWNWYIAIILAAVAARSVSWIFGRFNQKEKEKTLHIKQEIRELKREYMPLLEETGGKTGFFQELTESYVMTKMLPKETVDEYRIKSMDIVEKHDGKPYKKVFVLVLQALVWTVLLLSIRYIDTLPDLWWIPVFSATLTFIGHFRKKKRIIYFFVCLFLFFVYTHLSGTLNFFFLTVTILRFLEKILFEKEW